MLASTLQRAKQITENKDIQVLEASKGYMHFKVKRRQGSWGDVWWVVTNGEPEWHCGVTTEKKWKNPKTNKEEKRLTGCAYYKGSKKNPYCSHTMAAKLWILGYGI